MEAGKYIDPDLLDILEKKFIIIKIYGFKMAEEYTNLLGDTIWKINIDEDDCLKLVYLPNDTIGVYS